MKEEGIIYTKSLKEQVYEYLRDEISRQNLAPGSMINMDATSKKLGISKTPLRDALLQLEMEDFVTIAPRKGIYVNNLSTDHIRDYYQIIGSLESAALISGAPNIKTTHIARMRQLIAGMQKALENDNFGQFYKKNLEFHETYIQLCRNKTLSKIINQFKKRLYDFILQSQWIKEWEESSNKEHEKLFALIEAGQIQDAADFIRDIHWSYTVQEKFIRRYYFNNK